MATPLDPRRRRPASPPIRRRVLLAGLGVGLAAFAAGAGELKPPAPEQAAARSEWLGRSCSASPCRGSGPASPWVGAAFACAAAAIVALGRRRGPDA